MKQWLSPIALLALASHGALAAPGSRVATEPSAPVASTEPATSSVAPPSPPGRARSYRIPALDIVGFDLLVNRHGRYLTDDEDSYAVSLESLRRNLGSKWVIDNDPFSVNQFLHPAQGAMYHGFARSAGQGYWTSLGYTLGGSLLWEMAGETTPPAINDQIASGIGGTFFGEPLFRMANLLLERGGAPGRWHWREIAAGVTCPPMGFNRLAFGDRFRATYPSRDAACFTRLQVGGSLTALTRKGPSQSFIRNEALTDFSMEYGLPGKPGYRHERPFDLFSFQFTASSANGFENILTRGLLVGRDVARDNHSFRATWGLYGSYDYIAPQVFRVSSTALSGGATGQWWLSRSMALQGTALVGLGYAAASTVNGQDEHDYHYGLAPQLLAEGRLIVGQRLAVDATARHYYISRVGFSGRSGSENITRGEASLTVRLHARQAMSLKYVWTRRDAPFPTPGDTTQSRGTVNLMYTLLGDRSFGAVEWRPGSDGVVTAAP